MLNKITGCKIFLNIINRVPIPQNCPKLIKLNRDIFVPEMRFKKFSLNHLEYKTKTPKQIKVTQNALDTAILFRKVRLPKTGETLKISQNVSIAESKYKWLTTYHILEPQTNKEIGFVTICDWRLARKDKLAAFITEGRLLDDFPELGITGDRITIEYLQNNMPEKFSGMGEAADQIAIEYCLKNNIPPNIVSVADMNSHAAHFKRGKRFLKLDKNDPDIDYYEFKKAFGTTDPNKIIEQRIKAAPQSKDIECSDLGNLYMYMPQEVVQKYLDKIKKCPYLH